MGQRDHLVGRVETDERRTRPARAILGGLKARTVNPSHHESLDSKSMGTKRSHRAAGSRVPRGAHASRPADRAGRSRTRGAVTRGRRDAARTRRVRRRATRTARHRRLRAPRRGLRRIESGDHAGAKRTRPPGSMSGRERQSSPGATSRNPISSSSTCGAGSTSTCMARQSATRTAVLSGSATTGSLPSVVMSSLLARGAAWLVGGVVEIGPQRRGDQRGQRRARLDGLMLHLLDQRDGEIDVELLDLFVIHGADASILATTPATRRYSASSW